MVKVPRITETRVKSASMPGVRLSTGASLESFGGGSSAQGVTSATKGLASTVQNFAIQEIQRANEIKIQKEKSNLTGWYDDYLNNSKTGVLNRFGEEAFTIEYEKDFNNAVKGMEGNLANDFQRQAFSEIAQDYHNRLQSRVNVHVSNEKNRYETEVFESGLANESSIAINGFDAPLERDESLVNLKDNIKNYAKNTGKSSEWIQAKTLDSLSKTHIGVINNLISFDSDEARKYFNDNKSEINQDDLNESDIDKAVKATHKIRIAEITDGFEDKLLDKELTPQEVLLMNKPVSQGGIGSKEAAKYLKKIKGTQKSELTEIMSIKTVQEKEDKKYLDLVDKLVDDNIDNFTMKQVLVDAYIDGNLTTEEKNKLRKISTILKDVELNKLKPSKVPFTGNPWNPFRAWFRNSTEEIKTYLDKANFGEKAVSDALRKIIDYDINMDKDDKQMIEATDAIIKNERDKNYPEYSGMEEGKLYDTPYGMRKVNGYKNGVPTFELLPGDPGYSEIVETKSPNE